MVGQRAIDFITLARIASLEVVILCEGGEDATRLAPNAYHISAEQFDSCRRQWTNASLGVIAEIATSRLAVHTSHKDPMFLLSYAASWEWEQLANQSADSVRIVAPRAMLKTALDNKAYVRDRLAKARIPVPRSKLLPVSNLKFDSLAREFGCPIVIQQPVGSAGIGTNFVNTASELQVVKARYPRDSLLVSSYVGEKTLNFHGLVAESKVEVSPPSLQITGVPRLSSNAAAYCGSDFIAILDYPSLVIQKARNMVRRVGSWLRSTGYRGLFGVDLLVNGREVLVLEINPRLQGSTWMLSELEFELGRVPLAFRHFLELLGFRTDFFDSGCFGAENSAAFAIVHSMAKEPIVSSHKLSSGVYTLSEEGRLIRCRDGDGLLGLRSEEVLIFGAPPRHSAVVMPDSALVRFATRARLAESDGRSLTSLGRRILTAVVQEFDGFEETLPSIGSVRTPRRPYSRKTPR